MIHNDFRLLIQFTKRPPNNSELETDRISLLDIPQQTSGMVTFWVDTPWVSFMQHYHSSELATMHFQSKLPVDFPTYSHRFWIPDEAKTTTPHICLYFFKYKPKNIYKWEWSVFVKIQYSYSKQLMWEHFPDQSRPVRLEKKSIPPGELTKSIRTSLWLFLTQGRTPDF